MVFSCQETLSVLSGDKKQNWRLNEDIIAYTISRQPRWNEPHLVHLIQNHGYYADGEKEAGGIRLRNKLEKKTWDDIRRGNDSRIVRCNVCHEINHCLRSSVSEFCPDSQNNALCLHTGMAGIYPMMEASIRILAGRDLLDVEESAKMIAILRCYGQTALALDRAIAREEYTNPIVLRLIANPHEHKDILAKSGQEALDPISQEIIANTQNFIGMAVAQGTGKEAPYKSGLNGVINQLCNLKIPRAMNLIPEIPQTKSRYIDQL